MKSKNCGLAATKAIEVDRNVIHGHSSSVHGGKSSHNVEPKAEHGLSSFEQESFSKIEVVQNEARMFGKVLLEATKCRLSSKYEGYSRGEDHAVGLVVSEPDFEGVEAPLRNSFGVITGKQRVGKKFATEELGMWSVETLADQKIKQNSATVRDEKIPAMHGISTRTTIIDEEKGRGIVREDGKILLWIPGWAYCAEHGVESIWEYAQRPPNLTKNGFGEVFIQNSGYRYFGHWLDNKKNGTGSEQIGGGNIFLGEFSKDKKEGIGIQLTAENDRFIGEYVNDCQDGFGKLSHGEVDWIGYWRQGLKHGLGMNIDYINCCGSISYWNSGIECSERFVFTVVEDEVLLLPDQGLITTGQFRPTGQRKLNLELAAELNKTSRQHIAVLETRLDRITRELDSKRKVMLVVNHHVELSSLETLEYKIRRYASDALKKVAEMVDKVCSSLEDQDIQMIRELPKEFRYRVVLNNIVDKMIEEAKILRDKEAIKDQAEQKKRNDIQEEAVIESSRSLTSKDCSIGTEDLCRHQGDAPDLKDMSKHQSNSGRIPSSSQYTQEPGKALSHAEPLDQIRFRHENNSQDTSETQRQLFAQESLGQIRHFSSKSQPTCDERNFKLLFYAESPARLDQPVTNPQDKSEQKSQEISRFVQGHEAEPRMSDYNLVDGMGRMKVDLLGLDLIKGSVTSEHHSTSICSEVFQRVETRLCIKPISVNHSRKDPFTSMELQNEDHNVESEQERALEIFEFNLMLAPATKTDRAETTITRPSISALTETFEKETFSRHDLKLTFAKRSPEKATPSPEFKKMPGDYMIQITDRSEQQTDRSNGKSVNNNFQSHQTPSKLKDDNQFKSEGGTKDLNAKFSRSKVEDDLSSLYFDEKENINLQNCTLAVPKIARPISKQMDSTGTFGGRSSKNEQSMHLKPKDYSSKSQVDSMCDALLGFSTKRSGKAELYSLGDRSSPNFKLKCRNSRDPLEEVTNIHLSVKSRESSLFMRESSGSQVSKSSNTFKPSAYQKPQINIIPPQVTHEGQDMLELSFSCHQVGLTSKF